MSVYDELNDCIESAWSSDSCEYEVCSEMFDLIADAEYKYDNLKAENVKLVDMLGELYWCSRQLGCNRCTSRECCGTLNRMRELGIKVDE